LRRWCVSRYEQATSFRCVPEDHRFGRQVQPLIRLFHSHIVLAIVIVGNGLMKDSYGASPVCLRLYPRQEVDQCIRVEYRDGVGNYERAQAVGRAGPIAKLPSSLPCVRFLRSSASRRSIETRGRDISIGHKHAHRPVECTSIPTSALSRTQRPTRRSPVFRSSGPEMIGPASTIRRRGDARARGTSRHVRNLCADVHSMPVCWSIGCAQCFIRDRKP
jgi:hypothetical protein